MRPPRVPRAALGVVVYACAAAVAALGLPAAATSMGMATMTRGLGVAVVPSTPVVVGPPAAGGVALVVPPPPLPSSVAAPTPDPDAPTAADRRAGILRRVVVPSGSGEFDVASGSVPAPGPGQVHTVRVEVERGLPVDRDVFAAFVLAVLNDPRGWGHGGTMSFARTDGDAPLTVALAGPDTSARLCGDVEGGGRLSCRNGPLAVLTFERWVTGTAEYADNLTGYRQYVVNHEVGHALGHGHELCPGRGRPAPVMQQQTLGLQGCTQNSWPYP